MKIRFLAKKYGLNVLFISILLLLLLNPNAKAWFLNKLLYTGVFNISTKKNKDTGKLAPNLIFQSQAGVSLFTEQLKGKILFINFWATWCPPCMAEMPTINALHEKLKNDTNVIFVMADVDHHLLKSSEFMKNRDYDLPVYVIEGNIPPEIMNGSIPTTIIINRKGELVKKIEGLSNYSSDSMLEYLKSQ
ncbi:MAG TPA: TlpA disulfide reductase family protein [Puia sp.]|nr:TlpA disulfide reductase family protein [Puia sp.]